MEVQFSEVNCISKNIAESVEFLIEETKVDAIFVKFYFLSMNYKNKFRKFRSSHQRCSIKIDDLKISQNSRENTCVKVSFLEALSQMFSGVFCEIFKNTFFTEHLRATASANFTFCAKSLSLQSC